MTIKKLLYHYKPAQLYIVLVLSICYFSAQLVLSHITHALTLLMASYHMLCNIFALGGYIMTIKHSEVEPASIAQAANRHSKSDNNSALQAKDTKPKVITINIMEEEEEQKLSRRERREIKLRNTFGWTRIDILTMLIVCIILASLSFSLLVEALQTIVHIDHQDTMHLPIPVMILGFIGLVLNGLTYLLIGGYTIHQGSFLRVTSTGDVVLDRVMTINREVVTIKSNEHQLSESGSHKKMSKEMELNQVENTYFPPVKRQGAVEMLRDVSSTMFVIVCALIVYMAEDEEHTAKFIDPILSIFSCVLLVSLSYPYMKESCLILLQTIPDSIDMEIFERTLMKKFPEIVNYHDLHIWQLSAHKSVATVHIKFQSPKIYIKIIDDVRSYFHEQGVTEVTIQPEFHCSTGTPSQCLMSCSAPECAEKVCCRDSRTDLKRASANSNGSQEAIEKNNFQNISNESRVLEKANPKMLSKCAEQLRCPNEEQSINAQDNCLAASNELIIGKINK